MLTIISYQTSFVQGQRFISCLHKKINILDFNRPPRSNFLFVFHENGLIKIVQPSNIYQHTKFHGPTFIVASLAFTSEVRASAILERFKLRT
jgi:hypothetical protein